MCLVVVPYTQFHRQQGPKILQKDFHQFKVPNVHLDHLLWLVY